MALWTGSLPTAGLTGWVQRPGCGAVVAFAGTTRDHAEAPDGRVRSGVTLLEYEAYEEPALERLAAVATSVLAGWQDCGAVVVAHRLGAVPLGETSVLVAVSAPHRGVAFDAARHAIDATKATVPIWKREHHAAGVDWGADATPIVGVSVRPARPVADTGGAAYRAAPTGTAFPGGGEPPADPQERTWET